MLEAGVLDKEKANYFKFATIVLNDILGYQIREELRFEEDYVEFSFWNAFSNNGVCIEAKGTSTEDLFSKQYRDKPEHKTPITQTWDHIGRNNYDYGIATNYREFVLIDRIERVPKVSHIRLYRYKEK